MVERFDHLAGDRLQKGGGRLHLGATAKHAPGRLDGIELMAAAGDEQGLGQGKTQKAYLLGRAVEPADEVGKDAIEGRFGPVQLLMLVAGDEKRTRGLGKLRDRRHELASAGIGEAEMEPQPAASRRHRLIDIELLRRPVRMEANGQDQPRQRLGLHFGDFTGGFRLQGRHSLQLPGEAENRNVTVV
jgi:hypothetical protein